MAKVSFSQAFQWILAIAAIVLCMMALTENFPTLRIGKFRVDDLWFYLALLGIGTLYLVGRPKMLIANSEIIFIVSAGIVVTLWISVVDWSAWYNKHDITSFVMIYSSAILWTLAGLRALVKIFKS